MENIVKKYNLPSNISDGYNEDDAKEKMYE